MVPVDRSFFLYGALGFSSAGMKKKKRRKKKEKKTGYSEHNIGMGKGKAFSFFDPCPSLLGNGHTHCLHVLAAAHRRLLFLVSDCAEANTEDRVSLKGKPYLSRKEPCAVFG